MSANYKKVELTRGLVAVVSLEDYERVMPHRWWPRTHVRKGTKRILGVSATIGGKNVGMHRYILGVTDSKKVIDHHNGNVFDNRRCNLRVCDVRQNNCNGLTSRNHKGVYQKKGCKGFYAQITIHGVSIDVGVFQSEEAGAKAYDAAAREAFGDFARLNFPRRSELPTRPPRCVVGQHMCDRGTVYTRRRPLSYVKSPIGVYPTRGCTNKWFWSLCHRGKIISKGGFVSENAAVKSRNEYIKEKRLPHKLSELKP